jgi:protocatechuate 3,4-dioxygenase beta subunit
MSAKPRRRSVVSALALGATGTRLDGTLGRAETTIPVPPANETPGTCVLFPQAVEGPFYFDPTKLVRSDITEGRPGLPLTLVLKLIDNGSCAPIKNVRVDVWHCDAGGIYSGYPKQGDHRNVSAVGKQYLRATQLTDAKRPGHLQHDLSRLVSGTDTAHPR